MAQAGYGLSLRTKATVAVVAIILVLLAVTSIVSIIQINRAITVEQRRSVDSIAHSLARASELALAVRDDAELDRLATGSLRDPSILFVAFLDEKGKVLSHATQRNGVWAAYTATNQENDEFLLGEKTVEVTSAGEFAHVPGGTEPKPGAAGPQPRTVGKAVVALSTDPMYAAQQRQTLVTGGISFLAAAFCALLTTLVVRTWTRRLNTVVAASETISRGDYSQGIVATHDDEIGRLARAFEQMRLTVQQRDMDLRQFNQTLQQRVDERTRDLDTARLSAEQHATSFQEAEARIRSILDTAAEGIVTSSEEGSIESLNAAGERIFGLSPREGIGKNIGHLIPSLSLSVGQNSFSNFVGARRELTGCRKDGMTFPMELNVSATQLGGRRVFTGIVRDITDIKEAQQKLEASNRQLLQTSRQAGMAEVATGVLHNVGNVLNSVNVSATLIAERVKKSKIDGLEKVAKMLAEHSADLGAYITTNENGKQIPAYIAALAPRLQSERKSIVEEVELLAKNIEHIKDIVSMQQAYAGASGIVEKIQVTDLVEDAVRMNGAALARHDVMVVREYIDKPEIYVDRHKAIQILVNFIRNAKYALDENGNREKRLTLRVEREDKHSVSIIVKDNGVGIPQKNLTRIFTHGFTTRKEGHGFGLHSGALAAKELGGEISVHSDGLGKGAVFTVKLPLQWKGKSV